MFLTPNRHDRCSRPGRGPPPRPRPRRRPARPGRRRATAPISRCRPGPHRRSSRPGRPRRFRAGHRARPVRATTVALNRAKRTFSVPFACQGKGTLSVTAKRVAGHLARASYRCVSVARRRGDALEEGRRRRSPSAAGRGDGDDPPGRPHQARLVLAHRGQNAPKPKGFWTDGHLQCSQDGSGAPPAYLTSPTSPRSRRLRSPPAAGSPGTRPRAAGIGWGQAGTTSAAGTPGRPPSPASRNSTPAARRRRSRSRGGRSQVPDRAGHLCRRRVRDRLLGRRPAGLPVAVRERRHDGRGGGRYGHPLLRLRMTGLVRW